MRRRDSWLLLAAAALAVAPCGAQIPITGFVQTEGSAPLAGAAVSPDRLRITGSAVSRLRVGAPGPALAVRLEQSCALEVSVAALASEQIVATMRMYDGGGRPFWDLARGWAKREWGLRFGSRTLAGLPAGIYRVEVSASDGRSWQGQVSVIPAAPGRLEL